MLILVQQRVLQLRLPAGYARETAVRAPASSGWSDVLGDGSGHNRRRIAEKPGKKVVSVYSWQARIVATRAPLSDQCRTEESESAAPDQTAVACDRGNAR